MDVSTNNVEMKIIEKSLELLDISNISQNVKQKLRISPTAAKIFEVETLDPIDMSDDELEDLYFKKKKPCLLLVNKNLSFDSSFKGDFNLQDGMISRDNNNEFIFTGLQILDQSVFSFIKDKIFSMNKIWNHLIEENSLIGNESKQKFYHLNTKEMYDKISNLKITD